MRSMKSRGHSEVAAALSRVRKLHAAGRVHAFDREYIEKRLQEVLARIIIMQETDEEGREV